MLVIISDTYSRNRRANILRVELHPPSGIYTKHICFAYQPLIHIPQHVGAAHRFCIHHQRTLCQSHVVGTTYPHNFASLASCRCSRLVVDMESTSNIIYTIRGRSQSCDSELAGQTPESSAVIVDTCTRIVSSRWACDNATVPPRH